MSKLMICCFVVLVVGVSNVVCQETKTVRKKTAGTGLTISTYKEIPEASEQCAPAECDWWARLRQAGNYFKQKGDEKSKRKFVTLFVEGLEKSYRIPLKDRPPQVIVPALPPRVGSGVRPKNGKVMLSVEVRSDGSVGEAKIVEGLRSDMDERCIQAQRQSIFLPAVKDGVFVTDWYKAECGFWSKDGN
jgi:hypothetical protein